MQFTFEVFSLTQKEQEFKQTSFVTVKTSAGEITLYANHMPLITDVLPGKLVVKENGNVHEIEHEGGVLVTDKLLCQFFKTQKQGQLVMDQKEKKLSAEEITKQLINEFAQRLSQKQGIASS